MADHPYKLSFEVERSGAGRNLKYPYRIYCELPNGTFVEIVSYFSGGRKQAEAEESAKAHMESLTREEIEEELLSQIEVDVEELDALDEQKAKLVTRISKIKELLSVSNCPSCAGLRPRATFAATFEPGSVCPHCGHVEPA